MGKAWRWLAAGLLGCGVSLAHAGLSVYTSWSTLPPTNAANQRTVDFSTNTIGTEGAGRMTSSQSVSSCPKFLGSCVLGTSSGSVSQTASSSLAGFSGNSVSVNSGANGSPSSLAITFTNPTPYVGFLWGAQYNIGAQNNMLVNITLENNSVVTLKNCRDTSNAQCVGKYVSANWFTDFYDVLFGWLLGSAINYVPVYVQYQPDSGVRIKKVEFQTYQCSACGLLFGNVPLNSQVDYLTYVDATVAPHHYELTTPSATVASGADVVYTFKACGNADCSVPYISGATATLSIVGGSPSYPGGAGYSIAAGPNNTDTVVVRFGASGVATASLSPYAPTPTNTPKVFCGMGGVVPSSTSSCNVTVGAPLHHLEVTTGSAAGLTCNPVTYTVKACADAACAPYTQSVTGTLVLSGATPLSAFSFDTGATGVTTVNAYTTTAADVTASIATASLNAVPSNSPPVFCGMGVAAASGRSCVYKAASSGFVFNVPSHAAGDVQTVTMSAVEAASPNATRCTPAFKNVTKTVKLSCTYANPNDGTVPVVVNGSGLNVAGLTGNKCDGVGALLSLPFDVNGNTTLSVSYDDAGSMAMNALYTGTGSDAGVSLSGNDGFVTTPKRFVISTTGPYVAGQGYTGQVTAVSTNNVTTRNYGKESPVATTTFTQAVSKPTGSAAKTGSLSGNLGAFTNGVATLNSLSWSEVGSLDFTVSNANHLSSGLGVSTSTGTAGAIGPFVPHHFDVVVTQACAASGKSAFTYSEQPFTATVLAKALGGGLTQNYDGTANTSPNQARAANLAAVTNTTTGVLTGTTIAASAFSGGVATLTPTFSFGSKTTVPYAVKLQATEASPGTVTSGAGAEGAVSVRSGRLKLFNAFGSERTPLVCRRRPSTGAARAGSSTATTAARPCRPAP